MEPSPVSRKEEATAKGVLLGSGARTASAAAPVGPFTVGPSRAVFFLDVSAAAGTSPTLDVQLKVKDPASGVLRTLASFAQKTAISNEMLWVGGGADTKMVPDEVYVDYQLGGTGPSFTFSVSYVGG